MGGPAAWGGQMSRDVGNGGLSSPSVPQKLRSLSSAPDSATARMT